MKIYFLRHAKALPFSSSGLDIDRCLSEKGQLQAKKISEALLKIEIKKIYCSAAQRTRETISPFLLKNPECSIEFLDDLYVASLESWQQFLNKHQSDNVLFIGHNEGITEIVNDLSCTNMHLRTAELVALESMPMNGREIPFKVSWVYRPEG